MKHVVGVMFLVLAACGPKASQVEKGNVELQAQTNLSVGEEKEVLVVSRDVIENRQMDLSNNDLMMGLRKSEMGKPYNWGGVIVGIKAPKNPNLNHLKLSAVPNMMVVPVMEQGKLVLKVGQDSLLELPVAGEQGEHVLVDMEPIGKGLNLFEILNRGQNPYQSIENQTIRVNYIKPNITFDVLSKMQSTQDPTDVIEVVTRWYLAKVKPNSKYFKPRKMTRGVGFFGTTTYTSGAIQVFDVFESGKANIPVVVKNFPDVMKQSVVKALEEWNDVFQRHMGVRPIKYVFLDQGDPRESLIMAGDVRFNVIEWDIYNKTSYEGLGPCISSREQGKTLSCATLIQGPGITKRTASAFNDPSLIQAVLGSNALGPNMNVGFDDLKDLKITTGKMQFTVPALDPKLKDEHVEFEGGSRFMQPPKNISALEYLQSYIQSVVAHEFGHNLGLRHNFKASTFANTKRKTASVMDYLFTYTEHDLHVEEYDDMAVAYGYAGRQPHREDMYCSDEHVYSKKAISNSVECKRFDFSNRPYEFYKMIAHGILEDSLSGDFQAELKMTKRLLSFALEGIVGHAVNIAMNKPTKQFTASATSKNADFSVVYKDLISMYCGYRGVLMQNEQLDSDNAKDFEQVFSQNTFDFLPPVFPKKNFKCAFDSQAADGLVASEK